MSSCSQKIQYQSFYPVLQARSTVRLPGSYLQVLMSRLLQVLMSRLLGYACVAAD